MENSKKNMHVDNEAFKTQKKNVYIYIYIYMYIYKKQLMVASGQQRMPLRQEDQRFTVQASLHGIKTR